MQTYKILIVEDELLIAKNTAKKLRKLGYTITKIAATGEAAIKSVCHEKPDLILMDIAIKGNIDGIETAIKIKSIADIPVIFLTAYADDKTLERATQTSCYGYIVKPFKERELHAAIKITLKKYQEQSAITKSLQDTVHQYSKEYDNIYQDSLTGLPNQLFIRDLFEYLLLETEQQLKTEKESEKTNIIGIVYLNLNRFQKINDFIGNEKTDVLVKTIATFLTKCTENNNNKGAVARSHSHDFALMINVEKRTDINVFIKKIINYFERPIVVEGKEILVSTSIGVAFYPFDNMDIHQLLQQAKQAMEYAQQKGRNHCQWYTAALNIGSSKVSVELTLEAELHHALERQELELYYQPKINIKTGKIVGAEALIRWHHAEMGMISPNKFIPIAEETGLIIPIGEWILKDACKQLKNWHDLGWNFLKVAVNLSGYQFKQSDLFHKLTQILFQSKVEAQYLELELTEKILLDNIKSNVQRLKLIKNLGVQIALDDFGTGYSSLEYLQQFPFDILKIDRCFVRNIHQSTTNSVITQTIIQMAHKLNLKVVAEGVEVQPELEFLQQNECDEVQGFLFSRPLSKREFEKLVRQQECHQKIVVNS